MNWDDIRLFLALAEAGTIRQAAETLSVTHATVTRRIRSMEEDTGAILFDRTATGHVLTEAGRAIMPMAKNAERNMQGIERQILSIDRKLRGPVTLALPEAIATTLIAPMLPGLRARYPGISLRILLSDNLVDLAGRDTDLALRLTVKPPESAFGRCIANSPLCVFAAPAYLAARPSPDNWIGLDYEPAREIAGYTETSIQANGLLGMSELLAAGLGLGVLPCFLGDTHPGLVRVPGSKPKPDLDLWLLVHRDLRKVARIRAVSDFIAEHLKVVKPTIEGLGSQVGSKSKSR